MGATFCNLYVRGEAAGELAALLGKEDRLLCLGEWTMALAGDGDPTRMAKLPRRLRGEALGFYWLDDGEFALSLFRGGREVASVHSGGGTKKPAELAALVPEDENALKKLRAVSRCASLEEKLALLEETFGLPLYALAEQEKVPPVQRSEATWLAIKAREAAIRKRPNQYVLTPLEREDWPASVKARMGLIDALRKTRGRRLYIHEVYTYIGHSSDNEGMGDPACVFYLDRWNYFPDMKGEGKERNIIAYWPGVLTKDFRSPVQINRIIGLNAGGAIVCETLAGAMICFNEDGKILWTFDPERPQFARVGCCRYGDGELTLYVSGMTEKWSAIWRVDAENGRVLGRRDIPREEYITPRWVEELNAIVCYVVESRTLMLLDRELNEIRRFQFGERAPRYDLYWPHGHYLCEDEEQYIETLDLITGESGRIPLEMPAPYVEPLPNGAYYGGSETGKRWMLFDEEGRLTARFHSKDVLMGVWEEGGACYAATTQEARFPGWWEDSLVDTLRVFRIDRA